MVKKAKIAATVLLFSAVSFSSCGPGQLFGPTLTPSHTFTPTITWTPTVTLTPTATLTPTNPPPRDLKSGEKMAMAIRKNDVWDIYMINPDGTNLENITNDAASDKNPVWSPDGRTIAFISDREGSDELFVMNNNGYEIMNISKEITGKLPKEEKISYAIGEFRWSPDGQKIAFEYEKWQQKSDSREIVGSEIYVIELGSLKYAQVNSHVFVEEPNWSPDGTRLAFVFSEEPDSNKDIAIIRPDGTEETNISKTTEASERKISWSADGKEILFVSVTGDHEGIYSMNAAGGGRKTIVKAEYFWGNYGKPEFSPDGKKIAVWITVITGFTISTSGGGIDFFVSLLLMNSDGSDKGSLMYRGNDFGVWKYDSICWSPDSSRIAYVSDKSKKTAIYVMDKSTKEETLLFDGEKDFGFPDWLP